MTGMVSLRLGAGLLLLISLILSGCGALTQNRCMADFGGLMPAGWTFISQTPLDTDGKKQLDCVVLYRFDATKDGQKITPVGGVVYRQDHGRPRWIYPYPLTPPDDFYLGERQVSPRVGDVLSGSPQLELVIEDRDATGVVVQASIFGWRDDTKDLNLPPTLTNTLSYKPLGLFLGDGGVAVEVDKVTVLMRRKDTRSQLADRKVFVPREDKKNYYQQNSAQLPAPIEIDVVSLAMGDDPTASPYPEKTVLAFYQNVKDDAKLGGLMTPDALGLLEAGKLAYGCTPDRSQLDRVLVQALDWNQGTPDQPQVAISKGQCKLKDGSFKDMTPVTWQIGKVEGKWRITGIK
jgi:hypothetical protein